MTADVTGGQRPAEPGEMCTCGRQAVMVFVTPRDGGSVRETGYCGVIDGGDKSGPCPVLRRHPPRGRPVPEVPPATAR